MRIRKPTIDDLVFEDRNREYGSYLLRKRFHIRLLIGFLIALVFTLTIVLSYFWYLKEAGDENLLLYSAANSPYLKTAQGNLLSPEELADIVGAASAEAEEPDDEPALKKAEPVQSFEVTATTQKNELKPLDEIINNDESDDNSGMMLNDSTVFGGYPGEGMGMGGILDHFPEFPGGDVTKYVERNLRYPPIAIKQKIHGTVIVSFVINKTGHVTDVKVERGVNPIIDDEAVKTIRSMPPWKPAMRHGKPVNFFFRMPINFIPMS